MAVGIVLDKRFEDHAPGSGHPECPARLAAVRERLTGGSMLEKLTLLPVVAGVIDCIAAVHQGDYIDRFRQTCKDGLGYFDDPECGVCADSFDVALLAVGSVVGALDAVMAGSVGRAFCAVRPPGHHAERDRAMGFCFFNNVAIAARYLQQRHGLEKIFILDWDVHHGNGTQHTFESDPTVFYCSVHQDPRMCYPGTGFAHERGQGAGQGFTLNLPMPPGAGSQDYRQAFEDSVLPAIDGSVPDFVLISAGFDAHCDDPLAQMNLTEDDYHWFTQQVVQRAEAHFNGRVVSMLEGGYNLDALAGSVEAHLAAML